MLMSPSSRDDMAYHPQWTLETTKSANPMPTVLQLTFGICKSITLAYFRAIIKHNKGHSNT